MSSLSLCLLLVTCGGGGSELSRSAGADAPNSADLVTTFPTLMREVSLMPMGDSITLGPFTTMSTQGGYRPPLWTTARANGVVLRFVGSLADGFAIWPRLGSHDHEAHNGHTCGELLNGTTRAGVTPSVGLRAGRWVAEMQPSFVVSECGTNDFHYVTAGLAGLPKIAADMIALVDEAHAQAPAAHVYILSLPPLRFWRSSGYDAKVNQLLAPLVAARPWLTEIDLFTVLDVSGSDQIDGVHMLPSGNAKIAAALWSATNGLTYP